VDFLIRATVNYATTNGVDCDSVIIGPTPISPCPAFEFVVSCEQTVVYDTGGQLVNAVRLVIDLTTSISTTVTSATYSIDAGPAQVLGTSIVDGQVITDSVYGGSVSAFNIELQPSGCSAVIIAKDCDISASIPDPTDEINNQLLEKLTIIPHRVQLFSPTFDLAFPVPEFDQFWRIPADYDGYLLKAIEAQVSTPGSGANSATVEVSVQASTETLVLASTDTRQRLDLITPYVLATGDKIEFGLTAAGGTGTLPKGLIVVLILKATI
jgi:hypothetical protein